MLQIAICDDEKAIRDHIKQLVLRQQLQARVFTYSSARQLLASGRAFDIFLLDIRFPEGSGIQAARMLRARSQGAIIFITAFLEYVLDAFDVEAFHYLLKPIDEKKFGEVFLRAVEGQRKRNAEEGAYLLVKAGGVLRKLPLGDILYVESSGRKVIIHLQGEVLEIYGKMREMEEQLGEGFFRCHRCYLVQFRYIASYDHTSITLTSGDRLYLSREKYPQFLHQYMAWLAPGTIHDGSEGIPLACDDAADIFPGTSHDGPEGHHGQGSLL